MPTVSKPGQLVLLDAYETYVTCRKTLRPSISSPLAVKIEECGWRWNRADCAPYLPKLRNVRGILTKLHMC